jgi:uncharacterized protein
MKEKKPFVHLFRTPGGYYIYDVNKNVVIKTQRTIWEAVKEMQSNSCESDSENILIARMLEDGFLSSNKIKEIIHPADDILKYYLNRKIKMITLQVTQQCNLRCDYCVYSGGYENRTHSKKRMDFDMAKKCIDFYIEHSIDSDMIIVGFYGGEPLIEFELIKKCVLYVERISEGKKLLFTITSNGTLLNEEIIQFMEEHGILLRVSLDGPKDIHDKSRKFAFNDCGTFDKVIENIEMIKQKFPGYYKKISFSTVLDQKNDLSCISHFFTDCETIKDVRIFTSEIVGYYAKNEISTTEDYHCEMGYEHFKALLSEFATFNKRYVSKVVANDYVNLERMYEQLKPSEGLPEKSHHGGPCIPGTQRLFVNADGYMFPCERVSESSDIMNIGNINTGFDMDKIRKLLNIGAISEDKCRNCWAFRFCILCCASADTGNDGLSGDKKTSRCGSVRNMADNNLKDICTLKENNFDFNKGDWLVTA